MVKKVINCKMDAVSGELKEDLLAVTGKQGVLGMVIDEISGKVQGGHRCPTISCRWQHREIPI